MMLKIRLTMMFEDTIMTTWIERDGHKMVITPTLLRPIRPCRPRGFVLARERYKGPRRELNPKRAMSLFMFDVSWYDVWHHTKHIDPKATAMAESNSNVLYFVFHWHECDMWPLPWPWRIATRWLIYYLLWRCLVATTGWNVTRDGWWLLNKKLWAPYQ